jgi:hypothetical protein
MKNHFRLLIAIGTFAFLQAMSTGLAESTQTVVTGTGDPAQDVKAVQDAVDKGGTVLLRGRFNFGEKERVIIRHDIQIVGEADQQGKPMTQVIGGMWSFFSPLPSKDDPPQAPGPKITIEKIHFDNAIWTPIHLPYTSGAVISSNRITNVSPFPMPLKWQGGDTLLVHAGAILGTRFFNREKFLPGTTGQLIFKNNEVDIPCEKPEVTMGQGVFFIWTWGAFIDVKGNSFKNVSRNSIESLDNYRDDEGKGMVIIRDNRIVTPTTGCPFPGPTNYPNGIVAGWFLDPSGGQDPIRNSTVVIVDNQIEARGEFASGVISLGDGIGIASNEIVMDGGKQSKAILQFGSYGFVAHNSIKGSSTFGIWTMPFRDVLKGSHNTFFKNDTKLLKASMAEVLCEGNNNFFVGSECNFQDKGKDNKILIDG